MNTYNFKGREITDGQELTITPIVTTSDLSSGSSVLDKWNNRDGVSDQFGSFKGTVQFDFVNGARLINCEYLGGYNYRADFKEQDVKRLKLIKTIPLSRFSYFS